MIARPSKYHRDMPPSRAGWDFSEWHAIRIPKASNARIQAFVAAARWAGFPVIVPNRTRKLRAKYPSIVLVAFDVYEDAWFVPLCRQQIMLGIEDFACWGIMKEPAPLTTKEIAGILAEVGMDSVQWPSQH